MNDAGKQQMLDRIRSALGPSPSVEEVPRGYRTTGTDDPATLLDLLDERLTDYRAVVFRAGPGDVAGVVAEAVRAGTDADRPRLVTPEGLPQQWRHGEFQAVTDDGLTADELDGLEGVLTGAAVAIAETGTIVLDGSPVCGRRAITLVPDLHVCVVTADQIVASVPEGIRRLDARRPQTWISGPSATSDIELDRVEGVHGPRTLHVVLVGPG